MPKKKNKTKAGKASAGAERDDLLQRSHMLAGQLQRQAQRNAELAGAKGAILMGLSELEVQLHELQQKHRRELAARANQLAQVRSAAAARATLANESAVDQAGSLVASGAVRHEVARLRAELARKEEAFSGLAQQNAAAEEQLEQDQFEVRRRLSTVSRQQLKAVTRETESSAKAKMQQLANDTGPQNEVTPCWHAFALRGSPAVCWSLGSARLLLRLSILGVP